MNISASCVTSAPVRGVSTLSLPAQSASRQLIGVLREHSAAAVEPAAETAPETDDADAAADIDEQSKRQSDGVRRCVSPSDGCRPRVRRVATYVMVDLSTTRQRSPSAAAVVQCAPPISCIFCPGCADPPRACVRAVFPVEGDSSPASSSPRRRSLCRFLVPRHSICRPVAETSTSVIYVRSRRLGPRRTSAG